MWLNWHQNKQKDATNDKQFQQNMSSKYCTFSHLSARLLEGHDLLDKENGTDECWIFQYSLETKLQICLQFI